MWSRRGSHVHRPLQLRKLCRRYRHKKPHSLRARAVPPPGATRVVMPRPRRPRRHGPPGTEKELTEIPVLNKNGPGSPKRTRAVFSMLPQHGGGGTRTPKGLRPPHFECGALPIRLRLQILHTVGTAGFEPATPRSRSECSTGLSHVPKQPPATTERTGWDSNPRGLFTPHDFQSCSLSHSDTGPNAERRGRDSNPRLPFGQDGLANRWF